jgi:hypothetical protein
VENDQKKPTVHILQVGIDFEPILECAEEQKEQQNEATNTFGDNELEEEKKMVRGIYLLDWSHF